MITVGRVPAPVVHVVDMIVMRDGHVTTPLAVNVVMALVYRVTAVGFAFVKVIAVASVKMAVVCVVDMIGVRDRDVTAPLAVNVVMTDMRVMSGSVHCSSSNWHRDLHAMSGGTPSAHPFTTPRGMRRATLRARPASWLASITASTSL